MVGFSTEENAEIRSTIIDKFDDVDENLVPGFYAVTGSHFYGTASSASDLDIKGFHCAEGARYMLFNQPASQFQFQSQLPISRTTVEVTSFELRKFGQLLEKSDFSIVETVVADSHIYGDKDLLSPLEFIIEEALPAGLPTRYAGMARSIYERDISGESPHEPVDLKPYVYSLRGCLAAQYVLKYDKVEPHILRLADSMLAPNEKEIVSVLVSGVENGQLPADTVIDKVTALIENELNALDVDNFDSEARSSYRENIADWMLDVRTAMGTR